ncbi:MAG: hypothetical protein HY010_10120 [Acidobacteria bacterium]|nr:hypothetical protein [Acidobacteriota bacterium]
MTTAAVVASPRGNWLRSTGAVVLGAVVPIALALGTDQLLRVLHIFPKLADPMPQSGLNLLALTYRTLYGVLGAYLTARVAPRNPMRHALILGTLGFIVNVVGVVVTLPLHLGPAWYPIGLAVTALPTAWLGGFLFRGGQKKS